VTRATQVQRFDACERCEASHTGAGDPSLVEPRVAANLAILAFWRRYVIRYGWGRAPLQQPCVVGLRCRS